MLYSRLLRTITRMRSSERFLPLWRRWSKRWPELALVLRPCHIHNLLMQDSRSIWHLCSVGHLLWTNHMFCGSKCRSSIRPFGMLFITHQREEKRREEKRREEKRRGEEKRREEIIILVHILHPLVLWSCSIQELLQIHSCLWYSHYEPLCTLPLYS